jgi:hypothetical protein
MARKSLRSQLNQIRAWVRQGRTDAWIAHQLEVPATELREFRNRHGLTPDGEESAEIDLRDEIEAEIEAAALAAEEEEAEVDEEEDETPETADEDGDEEAKAEAAEPADGGDEGDEEQAPSGRRRRRRRRGGRGRGGGAPAKPLEATFDHGETDGYGLWLDPAVADDPTYAEHWRDQRAVEVQIEADRITIRRVEPSGPSESD